MQRRTIQRILGMLVAVFSVTMLPPLVLSIVYGEEGALKAFATALGILLAAGFILWWPVRAHRRELRLRDGFLVVVAFWISLGIAGSLPLYLALGPKLGVADAVFESMSALTTTGATVIVGIDHLPDSIRMYRQLLQWLGGMGIIVLAVAVLPMLGVGGMQLYRAETPGPIKDNKLTPRITETAKALWYIYLALTVTCALAYWVAGMSVFDAVAHSFSTIAIGGFSTYDESIGYFNNPMIEGVAIVFMAAAGANFGLHFMAWRGRSLRTYLGDTEFKTYVSLLIAFTVITSGYLYVSQTYENPFTSLRHAIFQVVSISTTTGFTTTGYYLWPAFLPAMLLFSSFIGGCAGSVGGGLKVIRVVLLFKQGTREVLRLIHPAAVVPIRVGGQTLSYRVVEAVWGFFAAYVASFTIIMLLLMGLGMDQVSAFSATAACMNNLGPGLGDTALNYSQLGDAAKWILCVAMLLGRLEVFTLLVVLSPAFWRR